MQVCVCVCPIAPGRYALPAALLLCWCVLAHPTSALPAGRSSRRSLPEPLVTAPTRLPLPLLLQVEGGGELCLLPAGFGQTYVRCCFTSGQLQVRRALRMCGRRARPSLTCLLG